MNDQEKELVAALKKGATESLVGKLGADRDKKVVGIRAVDLLALCALAEKLPATN